ncbi:ComEC/Rec2 family competence protein [Pseudomonas sp. WC2]|uniref:ComEC/Rec2 family competence protein n=1 Tax=Pseudomonas sp. WC2 TaxID=3424773 RepID=UPI003D33A6A3
MPIKSTQPTAPNNHSADELKIHTFGVGHGDCLLIELLCAGKAVFRMLSDAGKAGPHVKELITYLQVNRKQDQIDLDLVVLSHVDSDHQGGMLELFSDQSVTIKSYWAPCLPAFRRLRWLFSKRIQRAVDTASFLESTLDGRGIKTIYPMEGHSDRWVGGKATLSVISPPARLIRRLYESSQGFKDIVEGTGHLPIEWLLSPSMNDESEDSFLNSFDQRSFCVPGDFPANEFPLVSVQPKSSEFFSDESNEPNFFGNKVLNDTSLVLALDVWLDGKHRRRVLLTGDQENWAYIASRHPAGLGVDVLKVPHHGGMVYLTDKKKGETNFNEAAVEQTYLWLRPRIAIVSASGTYGLPHNRMRDALRSVGAAVMCTNVRGVERISPPAASCDSDRSCFGSFSCGKATQPIKSVLSLTWNEELMDRPGCVSDVGARGATPIVVMTQRLVEPDETFLRWTSGELQKHADWLKTFLDNSRAKFLSAVGSVGTVEVLALEPLTWAQVKAHARIEGRFHFLESPQQVLQFARSRGMIWSSAHSFNRISDEALFYTQPSDKDLSKVKAIISKAPNLIFKVTPDRASLIGRDLLAIMTAANTDLFCYLLASQVGLPIRVFREEVMPHALTELAASFGFRVCSMTDPRYDINLDNPAELLVHLRNKGALGARKIPDLLHVNWNPCLHGSTLSPLTNEGMKFLMKEMKLTGFVGLPIDMSNSLFLGRAFGASRLVTSLGYETPVEKPTFSDLLEHANWLDLG